MVRVFGKRSYGRAVRVAVRAATEGNDAYQERILATDDQSGTIYDFSHTVGDDEIDAQQHVHNLRYLQWALWAARDHVAELGWDAAAGLRAGVGWVVRDHTITYRAAALAGDDIVVRTWISESRRYAITRQFCIGRPSDQTILARGQTRWVFVDLTRHRALSIPPEAAAAVVVCQQKPGMPWEE